MSNFINLDNFNCSNTDDNIIDCSTQIGFTTNSYHQTIFICLSSLGILLSLIVLIGFIKEKCRRNKKRKSSSSMKKIFTIFPILDFLSSLYWFLSSIVFIKSQYIYDNYQLCSLFSLFYIFLFIFTFTFINFMLTHFRKIYYEPFESIIKSNRSFMQYLIKSMILSTIVSIGSFFLGIIGKSPMNTCFIHTEKTKISAIFYIFSFFLIFIAIYKVIHGLYFSKMFMNKNKERELFVQNSLYALIYCSLHIPMLILFIITFFYEKNIIEITDFLPEFSYFSTILLYYSPLIHNGLSIYHGMVNLKCLNKFKKKNSKDVEKLSRILNNDLTVSLTVDDQYDWLDKHAIKFFMRNILLGIAISIKKSKDLDIDNNFEKGDFLDFKKHEVNFTNFDLDDNDTKQSEYLDIKITEYAPKCFAYLRELENIDIDKMINSFLPKNNKMGMKKSAGKSGSFFISTDNGEYMIKTLKSDEFELIRHKFLEKYIEYISQNPRSLLCRLYGMYNISQYGGTEFYIIVMRNLIGNLGDNIVAKFDLKGSTVNRELKGIDMTKIDNDVMKDTNFNDIEFGIMVNNKNVEIIRAIVTKDSEFLSSLGLMDYSLFLVKLSLDKKKSTEIFGEGIQEKQEKDYMQIINDQTVVMGNSGEISVLNINAIKEKEINNQNDNSKYKHYKIYLYPGINMGTAYIISIIDFLQSYNFYKIVEYEYKTTFGIGNKTDSEGGISCVNPKLYSERFINYVNNLTQVKYILTDRMKK